MDSETQQGLEHFGQTLGFEHVPAPLGTAELRLALERRHCNRHGSAHGGVIMAILDTAGMWANTRPGEVAGGATVSINCNFLKGAPIDRFTHLRATAEVAKKGSRLYFAQLAVYAMPGDELVATGQGVYALPFEKPAAQELEPR